MSFFSKAWLLDTLERTIRTFAQTFLGVWLADQGSTALDISLWQTAGTAGLSAAIAVVMAALAAPKGQTISPASLVPATSNTPEQPMPAKD